MISLEQKKRKASFQPDTRPGRDTANHRFLKCKLVFQGNRDRSPVRDRQDPVVATPSGEGLIQLIFADSGILVILTGKS
jgi:hypothetical protein